MATRDLSRTVVEGGRTSGSKQERKRRARCFRRNWELDSDGEPFRRKGLPYGTGREFADRIQPLRNWLASRCGLPWADVYSEFRRSFDRRTTKGWHLLGHLKTEVAVAGFGEHPEFVRFYNYYVEDGVLRSRKPAPYRDRNAIQRENYTARKRARRRNGSR